MDTSTITDIVADQVFLARIQYYLVKAAIAVSNEDPTTAKRQQVVVKVMKNMLDMRIVAMAVISNPTIAALEDPTTVTDGDLEFTVNSIFGSFAEVS